MHAFFFYLTDVFYFILVEISFTSLNVKMSALSGLVGKNKNKNLGPQLMEEIHFEDISG
jgi:hypothetical protein